MKLLLGALFLVPLAVGCSSDCTVGDPTSCDPGLVCEPIGNAGTVDCMPPVELRGRVFDLSTGIGLGGAIIHAVDLGGFPTGELTVSGSDGAFTLRVPLVRKDGTGAPEPAQVTLVAEAQGYRTFPGRLRPAVPIDTGGATEAKSDQPWVLEVPTAQLGLAPMPAGQTNWPHMAGTVQFGSDQSVPLIVAEANGQAFGSTVADGFGQFVLFNLQPGTYSLRIYSQYATYVSADGIGVDVGRSADGLAIGRVDAPLATIQGNVSFPSGGGPTSVLLVPKSTYDSNTGRAVISPGLRAPGPGNAPNVTSTFSIPGVPDGDYLVLPAYENDGLVRSPSPGTGGTDVQEEVVVNGIPSPSALQAFQAVDAVQIVSPGAGDAVDVVSATPTLSWISYPSAASYDLKVFDEQGNVAFQATPAASDTQVAVTPALPRAIYQWRITAVNGSGQAISRSEELRGVFQVQ